MAREDNTINVGWFLVGAAVGAAVALLYAPQSGKDTRRLIAKKSEQSKEVLIDSGKEVMDRGKELFDRGRELAAVPQLLIGRAIRPWTVGARSISIPDRGRPFVGLQGRGGSWQII